MQLSLTYGNNTLDFQANGYKVEDGFYPEAATDPNAQVNERFNVFITGSTSTDITAKVRAINQVFNLAKQHPAGPDGVYINFLMDDTGTPWRARVTNGLVMWDGKLDLRWRQKRALASVLVERAPAWEGPEVLLPLTNPTNTNYTQGMVVYNPTIHIYANTISFDMTSKQIRDSANGLANIPDDATIVVSGSTNHDGTYTVTAGGHAHAGYIVVSALGSPDENAGAFVCIEGPICNYVEIAAASVDGDLPGLTRLEISNMYNSSTIASRIWIGQNWQSDPANLVHILQAEDADSVTPIPDGTCSGGGKVEATWSGTTESVIMAWDLTTALLDQLAGHYQRMLIRFASAPGANTWLRLSIYLDVTPIWSGPLVYLDPYYYLQELSSLRLPPYLLDAGTLYPLTLKLSAKHALSGSHSMYIDYMQITPLDGWRKLTAPLGYYLDYQMRLVDDGIDHYLYADGSSPAGKIGHYVGEGSPIMLQPNALQRLYFLSDNDTLGSAVQRTLVVKAYYRPRRWTV